MKPMLSEELMYVKDLIICLGCEQDDGAGDGTTSNQGLHVTK